MDLPVLGKRVRDAFTIIFVEGIFYFIERF